MSQSVNAVILREAQIEDAQTLIDYLKIIADEPDNGVMAESSDDIKYTLEQEEGILRNTREQDNQLMIVAVDGDKIVGSMNLHGGSRRPIYWTIGMGITLLPDYRNQGLGTRMMQYAIDWCEKNPNVVRLELTVFSNNPRAQHVYEKVGFVVEGVKRYAAKKYGEYLHMVQMAYIFEDKLPESS